MPTPPARAPWTPAERATLEAIARTLLPGRGDPAADLAAAALATIDPAQLRQLRLVLRLFDSRVANLLLWRRPARFVDLGADEQERFLLGWAGSRLAPRRAAFQAFKRVIAFVAGADPGTAEEPNPFWALARYAPAPRPVTAEPTPIRPFDPGVATGRAREPVLLDADVVVVGSGAGGGVIAAALARAGKSVVVLEAGPLVSEPEMPTNELDAFDRLYLDRGLVSSWDGSVAILAGGTVGGGTTVNWMTCIAPPDGVRQRWAREHGLDGFDGAETDADLAAIERELCVTGPPNIPPKDMAILRGAAQLGMAVGEARRNGVGCGDCGACPFGCRSGSKQSGLRAHLADAWRSGARIVPDARAVRVRIERGRAVGVDAIVGRREEGSSPRLLRVRAQQVVVSAGALRTPALLERSGVQHPALGRNLHLHPVAVVGAFFAEPVEMWRGTMQAAASLEHLAGGGPGGFVVESAPGHLGLAMLAFPWESRTAFADLVGDLSRVAPFIGIVADSGSGTVRATRRGTVRIDYRVGAEDAVTLRRALVTMARIGRAAGAGELVGLGTPARWWRSGDGAMGEGGRARKPGASRSAAWKGHAGFDRFAGDLAAFDFAPHRAMVFSAHQMGSARMGAAWESHPVDPVGRVRHGRGPSPGGTASSGVPIRPDRTIAGLYVGDASLFPSAIAVNPMVTVMALARRVARTVLAEAGR